MNKNYPSDIMRKQFEVIRPVLNRATKTTHLHKYDLYDIFYTVVYLTKEGCSWRTIPHGFPKWDMTFGKSRTKTASACSMRFYANWLR